MKLMVEAQVVVAEDEMVKLVRNPTTVVVLAISLVPVGYLGE